VYLVNQRIPTAWEDLVIVARLPGPVGVQVVAGSNPVAPTILKAADPEGLPSGSAAFDFVDPEPRPAGAPFFAEQLDADFETNVSFAGKQLPGLCEIEPSRAPWHAPRSTVRTVITGEQLARFLDMLRTHIQPISSAGSIGAVKIEHPGLNAIGITVARVLEVTDPEKGPLDGTVLMTLSCVAVDIES
jgi:hypothetical protein